MYWLQTTAILLGAAPITTSIVISAILIVRCFVPHHETKLSTELIFAGLIIVSILFALLIWYCRKNVNRRTRQMLGPRIDELVREKAGVRNWGWPTRLIIARTITDISPIFDLSKHGQSSDADSGPHRDSDERSSDQRVAADDASLPKKCCAN